MKKLIVAGLIGAALFTGCGADETGDQTSGDPSVAAASLVHLCAEHGRLQALSDYGQGSYGRTSRWVGVCKDGTVVEVKD